MIKLSLVGLALFLAGAVVGALCYPSKRVEEKERTISELRQEKATAEASVRDLEARTQENIVIEEKPDGTKRTQIIRQREETRHAEKETFAVEAKTEKVEKEKETATEINPRRFGIQVGIRTDAAYYLSADATLVGPIFFAVQIDSRGALGAGLGLRF